MTRARHWVVPLAALVGCGAGAGRPIVVTNDVAISFTPAGPDVPFDPHERDLLREHAGYGCASLWCIANERAYPFVFRPRSVRLLPCAQLVYCRSVDEIGRAHV